MNKLFSKIAALSVGLAMAIGVGVAADSKSTQPVKADSTVDFVFSDHYSSNKELDGVSIELDSGLTATFNKRSGGTATQYYTNGTSVRWYGGGTLSIDAGTATISEITLSFGSTKGNAITADSGTYTDGAASGSGTWSGSASSVLFTQAGTTGQDRISAISVTYSSSSSAVATTTTVSAADDKVQLDLATPDDSTVVSALVEDNNSAPISDATVSFSVQPESGVISLSGSDNLSRTVTAVGVGKATITASYAGVSETYKSSSGSIEIEVINSDSKEITFEAGTDSGTATSLSKSNITISVKSSEGDLSRSDNYRVYSGKDITFTSTNGNITKVVFTCSSDGYNTLTGTGYTKDGASGTWAGNAASFSLTASGSQTRITKIVVSLDGGGDVPTTYTMAYDANGGTGTLVDSKSPYDEGATVTVLANTFTRSGYTFTKWNTSANGSGTDYVAGNTFAISGNTTLYAQWSMNQKYTDDTTAKTITWDLSSVSYEAASADQVSWESPRVTMVADKAGAGTATNNYLPPAQSSSRFYKNSTITFTPVGEEVISGLDITAATANYATVLANSTWQNASATALDTLVTVVPDDIESPIVVTLGNTSGVTQVVSHYDVPAPADKHAVIDSVSNGTLNKTEVIDGATLIVRITPDAGYALPESVEVSIEGSSDPVSFEYENGYVTVPNVEGDVTIKGACIKLNPIEYLYTKAKGDDSGEFYGYYVGFLPGSGPVVMDGEYGILLYNSSQDVSVWTEGETIVHITSGKIDVYSGLYEVKNYAVEVVASADVDAPILHTTTGNEVANQASRITNATGFVATSPSKGNFTDPAGTSDIQFTFTVGSKTFTVFYKKASQEDSVIAKLADSLANQTEITLKGFTSWFNGFQVQMNGLIEAVVTYTAEDFSQDLLTQTDNICKNYVDGESSYSEFKALLTAVWSNLAGADKYPSLPSDQKTILAEAERVESGTVVERAMARYDFLTGKYELNNFINGRTPVQAFIGSLAINETTDNNTMIIIITIAAISAFAFTSLLVIKKKKHN